MGEEIHLKAIQERLWYLKISITMKSYIHVLQSIQLGASDKFNSIRKKGHRVSLAAKN